MKRKVVVLHPYLYVCLVEAVANKWQKKYQTRTSYMVAIATREELASLWALLVTLGPYVHLHDNHN